MYQLISVVDWKGGFWLFLKRRPTYAAALIGVPALGATYYVFHLDKVPISGIQLSFLTYEIFIHIRCLSRANSDDGCVFRNGDAHGHPNLSGRLATVQPTDSASGSSGEHHT